jgi:hypothetical protein
MHSDILRFNDGGRYGKGQDEDSVSEGWRTDERGASRHAELRDPDIPAHGQTPAPVRLDHAAGCVDPAECSGTGDAGKGTAMNIDSAILHELVMIKLHLSIFYLTFITWALVWFNEKMRD